MREKLMRGKSLAVGVRYANFTHQQFFPLGYQGAREQSSGEGLPLFTLKSQDSGEPRPTLSKGRSLRAKAPRRFQLSMGFLNSLRIF